MPRRILVTLLACLVTSVASAQATFTWTGLGADNNFTTPGNWLGNLVPAGNPTDNLVFPDLPLSLQAAYGYVYATLNTPVSVGDVTFSSASYYTMNLTGTGPITLYGNIVANHTATVSVPVILTAGNHSITGNAYVFQGGNVSGTGAIVMNGPGVLSMYGTNTYTGGTVINGGSVYVYNNNTLSTGQITLNGGTLTAVGSGGLTLANNFLLGTNAAFTSYLDDGSFYLGNGSSTLAPLAAGATTVNLSLDSYYTSAINIAGALTDGTGPATYTFANNGSNGGSAWILSGTNTYTGGTLVKDGASVIFREAGAIPATGQIGAEADGYAGVDNPTNLPALLAHLNPATFAGTIGAGDGFTYNDAINLSAFTANGGSVSLGTLDFATLTGLITPSAVSGQYVFKSLGTLVLTGTNPLTGAHDVVSLSLGDGNHGLLILGQSAANTYTGATIADHAAIVFNTAASLSAATTLHLRNGGYLGFTDASGLTAASLIAKVTEQTGNPGVIGIDAETEILNTAAATYAYSSNVDFSSLAQPVYLGTASNANFSGILTTTNAGTDDYYLTGYRGGHLEVSSQLAGTRAVHVGISGDFRAFEEGSQVKLTNASNPYSGGTYLYAGTLVASNPDSLGTGPITVDAGGSTAGLVVTGNLTHDILLQSGFLNVDPQGSLTLSGQISGSGGLEIISGGTITLSGQNSYEGETVLNGIDLQATTDTALGTGGLQLINGAHVFFTSAAPVLGPLIQGSTYDDDDGYVLSAALVLAGGSTLTINQASSETFEGAIVETGAGATVVKNGVGTLFLGGAIEEDNDYTVRYSGGTTINEGLLVAGSADALGAGTITINGGALGLAPDVILTNQIVFGGGGGTLAGNGAFGSALTVGTKVNLAPGESPGHLDFTAGLTLASGGTLEFEIKSATGAPGDGYDLVSISTGALVITATSANQFNIVLTSLDFDGLAGAVYDFSSSTGYTWLLFEGNPASGITGFSADKFSLNVTGFTNPLNGGVFSLTQGANGANPALYLNFSPVPEPSTYALLAAGLAPVLLALRRRRR